MLEETKKIKDELEEIGIKRSEVSARAVREGWIVRNVEIEIKTDKLAKRLTNNIETDSWNKEGIRALKIFFHNIAEDLVEKGYYVHEAEHASYYKITLKKVKFPDSGADEAKYITAVNPVGFSCDGYRTLVLANKEKNKDRIEVSVDVFNVILERCGCDRLIPEYWQPQSPESSDDCFIEIWSDGTIYGVDDETKNSYDLFFDFFSQEEEWEEIQEEVKQIREEL